MRAEAVEFAVLGMGINFLQDASASPEALKATTTSCLLEGVTLSVDETTRLVLNQLGSLYARFQSGSRQPLLLEWTRRTGAATLPVLE